MATNTKINGQDYYRIRRTIAHKADGSPIVKNFYGSSKGDAEHQYSLWLQEEARKKYEGEQSFEMATIHSRAKEYIENNLDVTQKYSSGTKVRYKSAYNVHVKGTWLDKAYIKDLHPADIQRFYNELDVTKSTLKQVHRFMSAFFKWMCRYEYATDIISVIDLPIKKDSKKSESIVIWDDKSWDILTSQYFDFRHDLLIKLLCYSGMRIGECLGLKYSDIEDDVIHIRRQYSMGEIKKPKHSSGRDVPMHDKVKTALEKHRAWHAKEMKANGYKTDYVFTTPYGTLYDHSNLARAFKKFYRQIGVEDNHFHVYRATFCTKLCEAGVPLEVASKILGHKSLEVTAAHYALVRSETKADAINKLK